MYTVNISGLQQKVVDGFSKGQMEELFYIHGNGFGTFEIGLLNASVCCIGDNVVISKGGVSIELKKCQFRKIEIL